MTWSIEIAVAPKVGFATHQNAIPVVRSLAVTCSEGGGQGLSLSLAADPPFVHPRTWRIDAIGADETLGITDHDVVLDATMLRELTESLSGTLTFRLADAQGETLAAVSHAVELLARNHWGGVGTMAELLPAFVMPNDPAIDRVLKAASDALRLAGKPGAIDGYKSGRRERVWELASAIWSAVVGLELSYALPPASFERTGQKIRTPSQILDGRVATCLDTALLFAAALEQANLNPLIVLTDGHAFTGVWLQPVEFASLLTDEAAALRRRCDLDDLVVFETTLATQQPPVGFAQAIAIARRQLDDDATSRFEMAIDVRRARMQKIRPLVAAAALTAIDPAMPTVAAAMAAAPALAAFEIEVTDAAPTPADRILQWQRRLLNLTTSNNLLDLKDGKSVVRLLAPDPSALEDMIAAGKRIRIVPMPDLAVGGRDEATYETQTRTNLRIEIAEAAMARGEALSLSSKDKLDTALVELYRKASGDMEEGGANTLYLALGFLHWKKAPSDAKSYRAPLILLPVKLERKSALSGVMMIAHEDEPRFNLTLLELLRQDFELSIPGLDGELPRDASGIDVAGIWRTVRGHVRDMPGFEVVPDVALGTFSFAKYLMWKDLVDRADRLKDSPLVRHLIDRDGALASDGEDFPRAERIDATVDPAALFTPLPADSSQLVAVLASAQGRDFVLDGPPGTGKSQTIANMIAHNLALGRRVLFVAEKRAALDVVQRRLADKGLAPFCLELHSSKATKSAVLKQLDRAWTTRDALTADEWAREAAETRRLRDDLNAVVALLHRIEPNGWTIHRAIGRTVRDADATTPRFSFAADTVHDAAAMTAFREAARRLGIARKAVDDLPAALDAVARTGWSNGWQEAIVAAATALAAAVGEAVDAHAAVIDVTGLPLPGGDRDGLAATCVFVELCLAMHGHDLRFAVAPDCADRVMVARDGLALITRYRTEEAALSASYAPEAARRINIGAMGVAWAAAGERFWFLATIARRKVARALAQAGGASAKVDPGVDLPRLAAMRDVLGRIDALAPIAAGIPGWAMLATDGDRIEQAIARGDRLRGAIAAGIDGSGGGPDALALLRRATVALVIDANDMLTATGVVAIAAARLRAANDRLRNAVDAFDALAGSPSPGDPGAMRSRGDAVIANARRLNDWTAWRRVRDEAMRAGFAPLVEALETARIDPTAALAAFETGYARWFAASRIDAEPLLCGFMPGEQEDRIDRFRKIDDRMAELSSRYVRAKLCGLIPDKSGLGRKDGYATLKAQLQLQRPSMPIRKLAATMGDAFTRLAPCMLMSPLSVAQYLPADQALFDLVIFDEASQITPWDAIGAMARGRQVVIAGDPRQMPPSSDFSRGTGSAAVDDDTAPDMDSILDECLAAGVPRHGLDWHYRSRHESLITFSNTRYYDSKLVTFPAPETRASAVSLRRVDGVYTRGIKTNPIEAQAIVAEAVLRLRDPGFVDERGRALTLGIITMNAEQMRLVEDLLDKARRAHPEIEPHFDPERTEPVCVRNLETVQGDERDLILLGVNFGPTEPGGKTMSMAMGKLNATGGWRRLNVAATRARREMIVFSSFDPGMIDLTRTAAEGVRDLKAFIEYAQRGPRALAEATRGSLGGMESPFEEAVADALTARGWTVVPQVGVSRFRIDLGIVHPDRPGDYLLGVECDGASYHSAATARDRDKVRAAILEGLGWTLLRIWSTGWWIDKQRAADRLHAAMEARLAADRAATETRLAAAAAAAEAAASEPPVPIVEEAPVVTPPAAMPAMEIAPVYARRSEIVVEPVADRYRATDFAMLDAVIDPDRFYETDYDATLAALIAHVLAAEAPIAGTLLVQRIARAHGFQRAGRVIRDRVMASVAQRHEIEVEPGGGRFIWSDAASRAAWDRARYPASDRDVRQIEDIALAELRVARHGHDAAESARRFGVRRLSAPAKARLETV